MGDLTTALARLLADTKGGSNAPASARNLLLSAAPLPSPSAAVGARAQAARGLAGHVTEHAAGLRAADLAAAAAACLAAAAAALATTPPAPRSAATALGALEAVLAAGGADAASALDGVGTVTILRQGWGLGVVGRAPARADAPPPSYRPPHARAATASNSASGSSDAGGSGGDSSASAKARAAACRCVSAAARADARALAAAWTLLLPGRGPSTTSPPASSSLSLHHALTLSDVSLRDPCPRVRAAAHAAVASLFDGPRARAFWAVADDGSGGGGAGIGEGAFTSLSRALGRAATGAVGHAVAGAEGDPAHAVAAAALRAWGGAVAALPWARLAGLAGSALPAGVRAASGRLLGAGDRSPADAGGLVAAACGALVAAAAAGADLAPAAPALLACAGPGWPALARRDALAALRSISLSAGRDAGAAAALAAAAGPGLLDLVEADLEEGGDAAAARAGLALGALAALVGKGRDSGAAALARRAWARALPSALTPARPPTLRAAALDLAASGGIAGDGAPSAEAVWEAVDAGAGDPAPPVRAAALGLLSALARHLWSTGSPPPPKSAQLGDLLARASHDGAGVVRAASAAALAAFAEAAAPLPPDLAALVAGAATCLARGVGGPPAVPGALRALGYALAAADAWPPGLAPAPWAGPALLALAGEVEAGKAAKGRWNAAAAAGRALGGSVVREVYGCEAAQLRAVLEAAAAGDENFKVRAACAAALGKAGGGG